MGASGGVIDWAWQLGNLAMALDFCERLCSPLPIYPYPDILAIKHDVTYIGIPESSSQPASPSTSEPMHQAGLHSLLCLLPAECRPLSCLVRVSLTSYWNGVACRRCCVGTVLGIQLPEDGL
jgi:hypothetical protein